ncbi:K(+)/H(+) antiporter NhaP [Defluviimonas aquaemixtae]|uniref:K(+)/H(+) antiporter NhaP n=1 Tax=Albidovulum aquaemixtae TaxID=1542388 RepID=A0A2R8BNW5_9RHOB|nr:sodium:proton antiporter [Defluviimonas aquaemixtae]SPH25120.1 K(+)/H(+) antiporter NhaP [Defluviimonas aquaemixtae]
MAIEQAASSLGTVPAVALVGALGVGSQWLAWRLQLPAIVLMLVAGVLVGPVLGLLNPAQEFGELLPPLIALAVAVILFEGGLTLNLHKLGDARAGVLRLVLIGAPLGWLLSALALHYAAGLGWEAASVFGGIMIVTGPTVIAPLLRHARLQKRPAALLQWEAIVNDPIGAMAAVAAFHVVLTRLGGDTNGFVDLAARMGFATMVGLAAGYGIVKVFKGGRIPEYMKVPVLFAVLLAAFALSDHVLHESGLLAVTVMGLVIANADLPSYEELRRFKEHATVLLVSGVFILLAASLDFAALGKLTWRAVLFVAVVALLARPATVLISLIGTAVPWKERLLIALTGPRGVVLVAVAGLFGERLVAADVADGALIGPLAFALVAATVVLHGFTLTPLARWLGLADGETAGVLLVGGSRLSTALAEALAKAEVPVLIADPNHSHLFRARTAGIPTFYGDILGEAAENSVEFLSFRVVVAMTDNDAYNTLVTTDLAPEFGRDNVWQLERARDADSRHALPTQLGGKRIGAGRGYRAYEQLLRDGWTFRVTRISEEFGFENWREKHPEAIVFATLSRTQDLTFPSNGDPTVPAGARIISLVPASVPSSKATAENEAAAD